MATFVYPVPASGGINWSDPVDANLVPDGNNTRDIGASGTAFKDLYINKIYNTDGTQSVDFTTGIVFNSAGIGADINFNSNTTGKVVFGAENFFIYSQLGGAPMLRFFKAGAGNYVQLGISNSISTDTSYVLPLADGTAQHALLTDGSGNMSWGIPRLSNNSYLTSRNAANDGDINLARVNGSDHIQIGTDSTARIYVGAATDSGSPTYISVTPNEGTPTNAGVRVNVGGSEGFMEIDAKDIYIAGDFVNTNVAATIYLYDGDYTNALGIKAPNSISSDFTLTLPGSDAAGPLVSNGSGTLSFQAGTASATFTTVDGKTVTVTNGVITNVV